MTPTKEQILAADDRQLDAWSAEYVMGWHVRGCFWLNDTDYTAFVGNSPMTVDDLSTDSHLVWRPASFHDHAQKLLNKIITMGIEVMDRCGDELHRLVRPQYPFPSHWIGIVAIELLTASPRRITQAALLACLESNP